MVKMALGGMAALALVVTIAIGRGRRQSWRRSRAGAGGDDRHRPLARPVVAAEPDQAPFDQTWRDAASRWVQVSRRW